MKIIDIFEAQECFSELIDVVIHGSEIAISMAGKPVAKLAPISKKYRRKFGVLKGKIKITKDFDAPLID